MALPEEMPYSKEAAEEQLAEAETQAGFGARRFPGMSYEEGVANTLRWVLGHTDEIPYTED